MIIFDSLEVSLRWSSELVLVYKATDSFSQLFIFIGYTLYKSM